MAIYLANADSTIMRYSWKAKLDGVKLRKKPQRRNAVQCRSRLASIKWNFLFKQVFQRNDFVDALDQELGRASIGLAGWRKYSFFGQESQSHWRMPFG